MKINVLHHTVLQLTRFSLFLIKRAKKTQGSKNAKHKAGIDTLHDKTPEKTCISD